MLCICSLCHVRDMGHVCTHIGHPFCTHVTNNIACVCAAVWLCQTELVPLGGDAAVRAIARTKESLHHELVLVAR